MYKGACTSVFKAYCLSRLFIYFLLQNDVEAPAYLRTPGYAPESAFILHMCIPCDKTFDVVP